MIVKKYTIDVCSNFSKLFWFSILQDSLFKSLIIIHKLRRNNKIGNYKSNLTKTKNKLFCSFIFTLFNICILLFALILGNLVKIFFLNDKITKNQSSIINLISLFNSLNETYIGDPLSYVSGIRYRNRHCYKNIVVKLVRSVHLVAFSSRSFVVQSCRLTHLQVKIVIKGKNSSK